MGRSLGSLPLDFRATIYRQFAADALRRAEATNDGEQRESRMVMAARWHALAIEAELDHFSGSGETAADAETVCPTHWFREI